MGPLYYTWKAEIGCTRCMHGPCTDCKATDAEIVMEETVRQSKHVMVGGGGE